MKVFLIRHGETEANVKKLFTGATETPLTINGILQAKEAQQRYQNETFDVVITSTLSRAIDTAQYIAGDITYKMPSLNEMNFGIFEGLSYDDILLNYPEKAKVWQSQGSDYTFEEGDSLRSFYKRITDTFNVIKASYTGNVLIVAHSGVIRSILAHEISNDFDHYWKYKVDHCKMSVLNYSDGMTILEGLNI